MNDIMSEICICVILYYPKKEQISRLLGYVKYCNTLLIYDNSEYLNNQETLDILNRFQNANIVYNKYRTNMGLSKCFNLALKYCIKNKIRYLLTLDQDSEFNTTYIGEMINQLQKNDKMAIITPNIKIINKIMYKKGTLIVFSSGNILNVDIFKNNNIQYEELLFIDKIDDDICLKIIEKGFEIGIYNEYCMTHDLGKNAKNRIGKIVTNHDRYRRYYITRNGLYLIKKYKNTKNKLVRDLINNIKYSIIKDYIKILLFERNKAVKTLAIIIAIRDIKVGRMGKRWKLL